MGLRVAALSFQLIDELRPLVVELKRKDRALADQLMRAASSVALNIAEGDVGPRQPTSAVLHRGRKCE